MSDSRPSEIPAARIATISLNRLSRSKASIEPASAASGSTCWRSRGRRSKRVAGHVARAEAALDEIVAMLDHVHHLEGEREPDGAGRDPRGEAARRIGARSCRPGAACQERAAAPRAGP